MDPSALLLSFLAIRSLSSPADSYESASSRFLPLWTHLASIPFDSLLDRLANPKVR